MFPSGTQIVTVEALDGVYNILDSVRKAKIPCTTSQVILSACILFAVILWSNLVMLVFLHPFIIKIAFKVVPYWWSGRPSIVLLSVCRAFHLLIQPDVEDLFQDFINVIFIISYSFHK